MAVATLDEVGPTPRSAGRKVDGAEQMRLARDKAQRVALIPGVVAERDDIGARCAQFAVVALGEAAAVAGVLAVDDDEIEAVVGDNAGEALGDGVTTGASDDVAQEQ